MQWAQWAGKATGIVTTTRVTHASPAGTFAHSSHRDWESDAQMIEHAKNGKANITQCEDIAKQLITKDPGRNFKVCNKKKFQYVHWSDVKSRDSRTNHSLFTLHTSCDECIILCIIFSSNIVTYIDNEKYTFSIGYYGWWTRFLYKKRR